MADGSSAPDSGSGKKPAGSRDSATDRQHLSLGPLSERLFESGLSQNEFVRTLIETSTSLIICLDRTARLVLFNAECERVTGYRADEVVGQNWHSVFVPEEAQHEGLADFGQWVRDNPRDTYEGPLRTKSGEVRTILWSTSAVFSDRTDEIAAIAIGHDITDLKRTSDELTFVRDNLERMVVERTADLEATNLKLRREMDERQRMQESLRETETRFEELAELLPLALFETDTDGRFTYLNRTGIEWFGLTPAKLKAGFSVADVVVPDEHERLHRDMGRRLAGEHLAPQEWTAVRVDGSTFPVVTYASLISKGDQVLGGRGVIVDVTEQKEAERQIRQSERRYREVLESAGEGIIVSQEGKVLFANAAVCKITGYDPEAMLQMSLFDHVHPEDQELARENYGKRLRGETVPLVYELRTVTRTGETRWIEINAVVLDWFNELAVLHFIRDVTDRKEAVEALRLSEENARALLNATSDFVFLLEPSGIIISVNGAAAKLLGAPADVVKGTCVFEYFTEELRVRRTKVMGQVIKSGKPYRYEEHRNNRDFDSSIFPVKGESGKVERVAIYVRDITELKQTELRLRQTTEALRSEQSALKEKNIALKQVLDHIATEKEHYKNEICRQIQEQLRPVFDDLLHLDDSELHKAVRDAQLAINALLDKDIQVLSDRLQTLSPRELQICDLIRNGWSSKQISEHLNLSPMTIHKHREQIRKKLGLVNKEVNLMTFLRGQEGPNDT